MKRALVGFGLVIAGCSSNDGGSDKPATDAGGTPVDSGTPVDGGAQPGTFALTSPAFAANAAIPVANSCSGADTSPAFAWTSPPGDTKSFALALVDPDANNLKHWVIYDIPATATGLPADVEGVYAPGNVAGAHQTASAQQGVIGYYGPCPPALHHYHFTVYALDVAALPGATATTSATEALAAIATHMIGHAELIGTFQKP